MVRLGLESFEEEADVILTTNDQPANVQVVSIDIGEVGRSQGTTC